jgi:hypothetical protein
MELSELFGLPAHPLIVHAAVVLLPLAAVATLVLAIIPRARRIYAPIVLGLAVVAALFVNLAEGSGESLEDRVTETQLVEEHTDKGEGVFPWAIGVAVVAGAVTAAALLRDRLTKVPEVAVTGVLVVAALAAGIGATWTIIDAGHSGARAVWNDTPPERPDDDDD